ncbi:MAG: BatA domain-containing protein [Pirellulales bacterium]|nr:BatA domain-containing protein [Pirellulales bacterium]
MTFAAPLFLIAALAAAIPVLLHLIDRRQAKKLPFPTLRFLKLSAEKTRRRKRIHDLLLMLLRAAVLLLIALGLAKPTVTNLSALWGGADTAAAIILDNSASMGAIDADRMRFDAAAAAVAEIVDELRDGDQMAFLATGGPDFPGLGRLDRTKQSIREILPLCKVSYERADLEAKISQARRILAEAKTPNKQIYVVTDMQKACWEEGGGGRGAGGEGTDEIPIIFVDCRRKPKPNVAVQSVAVSTIAPVAGVPIAVDAEFYNASTVSWPCVAELYIDGAKEAVGPTLNLPPDGRAKHDFTFTCKTGGLRRGEIRLAGEDGSKFDDRRFFTLDVDRAIPVAIVKSRRQEIPYLDDSYYLERALSAGRSAPGAIRAAVLTADDLAKEPLAEYKAIFLVNLPAPHADAAERLRTYVENGGNLIWIAGDNVDPDAYNLMDEQAKGVLLPAPLLEVRAPRPQDDRDSWRLGFLDKQFPAFSLLTEPASLYESVLVYKHIKLSADAGQVSNLSATSSGRVGNLSHPEVLARLDDGEPLLVEKKSESGRVFFLGTGVHINWTNLPLRPIFLPLVSRLVFALAQVEKSQRSILAGRPIEMRFPKSAEPLGIEIVPPSGEIVRLKTRPDADKTGQEFRYGDTHEIGVYLLRLLDAAKSTPLAYAANVDPAESDPAALDREILEKRYAPAPLLFADPADLSDTFKTLREGKSLWGLFLIAVLLALVFETYLSNRLGPKKRDENISL